MTVWQNRIVGYREVDPEQLLANPLNWRIHSYLQQQALESILSEVGWVQNVIVNTHRGDDVIVDGHARVALAIQKGQPSVPVTDVDLPDDEMAKVLAVLDPIGAMAATDAEKYADLLGMFDVDATGLGAVIDAISEQQTPPMTDPDDYGALDGEPDEPEELIERGSSDGSLLSLVDVTIADPRHTTHHGEVWTLGRHILVVASVAKDYDLWTEYLTEGCLFCPYPGPFAPLTTKAETMPLLLVQPNTYIAGHILDRWDDVKGEGNAVRA